MSKDVVTAEFEVDGSFTFDVEDLTSVDPDGVTHHDLETLAYARAVDKMSSAMAESPEMFIDLGFWEAKDD
jgi:hypothetical protein